MIALLFNQFGDERLAFDVPVITIGSAPDNTLVRDELAPHHCRLEVRAAGCLVIDCSGGKTRVNGKTITAPRALYSEDIVEIGMCSFLIDRFYILRSPLEYDFLEAIERGDDCSRQVYADWLEENGDDRRAELLRILDRLAETTTPAVEGETPPEIRLAPWFELGELDTLVQRLRTLWVVVDRVWRVRVARGPIVRCAGVDPCDLDWSELATTDRTEIRRCPDCHAQVAFCESPADIERWIQSGQRAFCIEPTMTGAMVDIPGILRRYRAPS